MSKFQDFVDEHVAKKSKDGIIKVTSAINKRWETRIVAQGLDKQGAAGAQAYLARYGNNIAAPKVIDLALCAQSKGAEEMALGFWVKAHELTFGITPTGVSDTVTAVLSSTSPKVSELPVIDGLPDQLQPGKIHTMQAIDAPKDREHYINNALYWGQPKRDGHRTLVIATPDKVHFQTRNLNLIDIFDISLVDYFRRSAGEIGIFVLDGELWYRSFDGKEHRTAAQAAEWNVRSEQSTANVVTVYTAFKFLYFDGNSLLDLPESCRLASLQAEVWTRRPDNFEICPTAISTNEKKALVKKQKSEGREGEVWINFDAKYIGGKTKNGYPMVRTKYLSSDIFVCVGVTPTTAENRLFGALEISEQIDGELIPVGKVGTGFDAAAQKMLMAKADRGKFYVKVEFQGRTTAGKLMHARYKEA